MRDKRYRDFQEILKRKSARLASIAGYDRLMSSIEKVADWDGYMAIEAQIDVTFWFRDKGILKEIEPKLSHRAGYADILLSFSNQDIYCEVNSFESLAKSIESKTQDEENKKELRIQKLMGYEPWLTNVDAKKIIQNDKILRKLRYKINKQLPVDCPGILVLDTGKAMVYSLQIKEIAKKLFPLKDQVSLIMLWSLESGSDIGERPFWFVNYNSLFTKIGQELLKHIGQENKVIV